MHNRREARETACPLSDDVSLRWHVRNPDHDRRRDHEDILPDHLWVHMQRKSTDDYGVVRRLHMLRRSSGSASQPEFNRRSIPNRGGYCHKLLLSDMGNLPIQN